MENSLSRVMIPAGRKAAGGMCRLILTGLGCGLWLVGGCHAVQSSGSVATDEAAGRTAAKVTNADWEMASPSSVGLNEGLIRQLILRIKDNSYTNIHGVLLVKDGKLVVEEYFAGRQEAGIQQAFTRNTLHEIHSATKSINSILIGIAIDRHLITGVDQKISTFFPEFADVFLDEKKAAIRLKDLLSMTAGLSWDESTYPYDDARNTHVGMNRSANPVRYVLEQPMVTEPGTHFTYSSGISIVLGEIVRKASGLGADQFAKRFLFEPLGITDYQWLKYPNGVVQTGGGLQMKPRDMAKIGMLVLNGGRWRGKQIVSQSWLEDSLKQHAPDRTYGYQWWLGELQAGDHNVAVGAAQGRGGQFILVMPALQMVAVFTGWNEDKELAEQPYDMMRRYVLPAAFSNTTNAPSK